MKVLNITDLFDYLRFNFKNQDFVMRLPSKTQISTQKCNAVHSRVTGMIYREKREVSSHNKVRALFAKNKVRFARAEQGFHLAF